MHPLDMDMHEGMVEVADSLVQLFLNDNSWQERAKRTADELGLTMFLDTELEPRHLLLMSDQGPFREAGIPYVFFLAGNLDYCPEDPYRQTVKLGVIMNSIQDDLALLNQTFPGRAEDRLSAYSQLLYYFLLQMEAE